MDSQTTLIATCEQARGLARQLIDAADNYDERGEAQHVQTVLEQCRDKGPWRLIIHVAECG